MRDELLVEFVRRDHDIAIDYDLVAVKLVEEAMAAAGVAGGAGLVHFQQQGVAVAVDAGGFQNLHLAAAFALAPEGVAGAGPVTDATGLQGFPQGFCVHPGQHQYFFGVVLLRNRGNQSIIVIFHLGQQRVAIQLKAGRIMFVVFEDVHGNEKVMLSSRFQARARRDPIGYHQHESGIFSCKINRIT